MRSRAESLPSACWRLTRFAAAGFGAGILLLKELGLWIDQRGFND